jgi:hypothetical protein
MCIGTSAQSIDQLDSSTRPGQAIPQQVHLQTQTQMPVGGVDWKAKNQKKMQRKQ